ncbi:MAG: glutamate-cysteine ligase family protein [bacterium]
MNSHIQTQVQSQFRQRFYYRPEYAGYVGVERECFLTNEHGEIAPIANQVLARLKADNPSRADSFGYELSACQLEERTCGPCRLDRVHDSLLVNDQQVIESEKALNYRRLFLPVAPFNMPLDVYPNERYQQIVQKISVDTLRAACRVAGVHVHIGLPDHETALRVYNQAVDHFGELCQMGHTQIGSRLEIYTQAAQNMSKTQFADHFQLFKGHTVTAFQPPKYASWDEFHKRALRDGFAENPRNLWDLIRLSGKGTIEFRMFDTTADLDRIMRWVYRCHEICRRAMH